MEKCRVGRCHQQVTCSALGRFRIGMETYDVTIPACNTHQQTVFPIMKRYIRFVTYKIKRGEIICN